MSSFRRRRFALFRRLLNVTDNTPVLDVGGIPKHWRAYGFPGPVTCVNTSGAYPEGRHGNVTYLRADAARLPFGDRSFPVVMSNSLLEHVGRERQPLVAAEIRRVAERYWVQAPCRTFPWEPHFLAPFFWQCPPAWRRLLASHWTPRLKQANHYLPEVDTMHLPVAHEMRALFPDGRLYRERVLGLTKSLVAWRA